MHVSQVRKCIWTTLSCRYSLPIATEPDNQILNNKIITGVLLFFSSEKQNDHLIYWPWSSTCGLYQMAHRCIRQKGRHQRRTIRLATGGMCPRPWRGLYPYQGCRGNATGTKTLATPALWGNNRLQLHQVQNHDGVFDNHSLRLRLHTMFARRRVQNVAESEPMSKCAYRLVHWRRNMARHRVAGCRRGKHSCSFDRGHRASPPGFLRVPRGRRKSSPRSSAGDCQWGGGPDEAPRNPFQGV